MSQEIQIIIVLSAGAVGGLLNALLADGGFKSGYTEQVSGGHKIWRPGWVGNVFIGSIAAFIVWALYGVTSASGLKELLPQIAGAIITGAGGGRIITNEVDKRVLNTTNDVLKESLKLENKKDE